MLNIQNTGYKIPNNLYGQSLFEVVVAVGLAAMILSGVVSLAAVSVRNSSFTRNNAQATKYVQEEIEWLRSQRDAGWDGFVGTSSKIDVGGCDSTDNRFSWGDSCTIDSTFSRVASFECFYLDLSSPTPPPLLMNCSTASSDSINIVDVTVTVSWNDAQGTHDVKSKTTFTDWK